MFRKHGYHFKSQKNPLEIPTPHPSDKQYSEVPWVHKKRQGCLKQVEQGVFFCLNGQTAFVSHTYHL